MASIASSGNLLISQHFGTLGSELNFKEQKTAVVIDIAIQDDRNLRKMNMSSLRNTKT